MREGEVTDAGSVRHGSEGQSRPARDHVAIDRVIAWLIEHPLWEQQSRHNAAAAKPAGTRARHLQHADKRPAAPAPAPSAANEASDRSGNGTEPPGASVD
jgi:hypothetical protein